MTMPCDHAMWPQRREQTLLGKRVKTKPKPITNQLDYSANLKQQFNQNLKQIKCLIPFDIQLKTVLHEQLKLFIS